MDTYLHGQRVRPGIEWPRADFIWLGAGIAATLTLIGTLIIAGAGSTPIGQIMAVLVGFLVLGAGGVLALALAASGRFAQSDADDWPW